MHVLFLLLQCFACLNNCASKKTFFCIKPLPLCSFLAHFSPVFFAALIYNPFSYGIVSYPLPVILTEHNVLMIFTYL